MDNFVNSYLRIFYEDIMGNTVYKNQKIGHVSLDNFFENIILINDDIINENKHIIFEDKNVEYGNDVLDFIFNASFGQQIKKSDILVKLDENWKFFEKYKKSKLADKLPILVYKFDFSTDDCLKMFRHLDNDYVNSNGEKNIVNSFHENIGNITNGFVKQLSDCILICLNANSTLITVSHELTHYFQIVLNVNIFKNKDFEKFEFKDFPELYLSKDEIKNVYAYAFTSTEFPAHLYVDIVNDVKFVYENFFNDKSKEEFINLFINDLLKYKTNIFKSNIGKYFLTSIEDKSSIVILALSAEFNIHLKKILKCLRSEFK
jgi:hypothetical protein